MISTQVSWHPGWRYHQLKGSLLAVIFLDALNQAARKFQDFTMDMGPDLDESMYEVPPRPLPPPSLCGQRSIEQAFCDVKFNCATTYEPRVGQSILDLTKGLPSKYDGGKWAAALAPGEGDNAAHCTGHVDAKKNVLGKQGDGWFAMKLRGVKKGLIIVCEGPFSARMEKQVTHVNTSTNVRLELDGQVTHYQRKLTKSLCSVVTDKASPGDHTLAFQAQGSILTGFSYVIWA